MLACVRVHIYIYIHISYGVPYVYIYIHIYIRPFPPNIAPTGVFVLFRGVEFEPSGRETATKKPTKQSSTENAGPIFWLYLVFCFFCYWVCNGKHSVSQNQRTKIQQKQNTKKPKHQKNKTGFFVFWSRSSGGLYHTTPTKVNTYTNTTLTIIPRLISLRLLIFISVVTLIQVRNLYLYYSYEHQYS